MGRDQRCCSAPYNAQDGPKLRQSSGGQTWLARATLLIFCSRTCDALPVLLLPSQDERVGSPEMGSGDAP